MSTGFVRTSEGGVRVGVEAGEAQVIRALFGQLLDILGEPAQPRTYEGMPELALSDNTSVSDDPVVARLFPDAYGDDEKAAAEFRRYTEASLREGKRAAAEVVLRTVGEGGEIVLDADQAQAWLRALNDLRLALGTRLDITEETLADLERFDWSDPRNAGYAAYDWLTTLQESLVHAVW